MGQVPGTQGESVGALGNRAPSPSLYSLSPLNTHEGEVDVGLVLGILAAPFCQDTYLGHLLGLQGWCG